MLETLLIFPPIGLWQTRGRWTRIRLISMIKGEKKGCFSHYKLYLRQILLMLSLNVTNLPGREEQKDEATVDNFR